MSTPLRLVITACYTESSLLPRPQDRLPYSIGCARPPPSGAGRWATRSARTHAARARARYVDCRAMRLDREASWDKIRILTKHVISCYFAGFPQVSRSR